MTPIEQAIAEVTAHRMTAQTTVDQCDAALVGLRAVLQMTQAQATVVPPGRLKRRQMALQTLAEAPTGPKPRKVTERTTQNQESSERRTAVLALVKNGPVTMSELFRKIPPTPGRTRVQHAKDVSNTVQRLKALGEVKRAGMNWVKVTPV